MQTVCTARALSTGEMYMENNSGLSALSSGMLANEDYAEPIAMMLLPIHHHCQPVPHEAQLSLRDRATRAWQFKSYQLLND